MAIIKMVNVKAGKPHGLKAVLAYITRPDKTIHGVLTTGKDCMTETAYYEMLLTKQQFHNLKGRQYIHIIQSFPADEAVTPELVHTIGKQLLTQFGGFHGVLATHTDRKHIHNHIVLNSVNSMTGKKWQFSKDQLYQLRDKSDKLCFENGLSIISKGKGWKSYGEYKGGSWKEYLAFEIAQSLKQARFGDEIYHYLESKGIKTVYREKDFLFTMPDGKKCSNLKLMSYGDFSTENIKKHAFLNDLYTKEAMRQPKFIATGFQYFLEMFQDRRHEDMMNDYFNGRTPALEGFALTEWILKKKNGARFEYEAWSKQPQAERSNLLETVGTILGEFIMAEKRAVEKQKRRYYEQECEEYEEEWER